MRSKTVNNCKYLLNNFLYFKDEDRRLAGIPGPGQY